jgi:DNA repair protein RadC
MRLSSKFFNEFLKHKCRVLCQGNDNEPIFNILNLKVHPIPIRSQHKYPITNFLNTFQEPKVAYATSEKISDEEDRLPPLMKEVEIIYSAPKTANPIKLESADEAYNLLMRIWDKRKIDHKEMFFALFLNRNNIVIGYSLISIGQLHATVVNVREIFQLAILSNAAAIILSHNHPSGNLVASKADLKLTKDIAHAGKLLEILLLDHVIITSSEGYLSLAQEGLI